MKNIIMLALLALQFTARSQSPLNWTRDEINPGEDFTLSPDESIFTEGTKSLKMTLHTGAVPYLVSEVFYITPGAGYNFSIDVFDNDTLGQVKIYADFYDTYGFDIFGNPPVLSSDSSQWQTINWTGTVPGQAVVGYILVKFYCQPDLYHFIHQAEVWIDHVRFIPEGGINLVANGGFEDWNVGVGESLKGTEVLSVYPNPVKDFVDISWPGSVKELRVIDGTGAEIFKKDVSGTGRIHIDMAQYPGGIYLVALIDQNGAVLKGKLIKY